MQVSSLTTSRQCRARRFIMMQHNYFYPPCLHRPLITVPPALTGAAITVLALAEPFIGAGAAVAFWYFCPIEKGKAPAAMSGMKS